MFLPRCVCVCVCVCVCACSIKWTALVTPFMVAFECFVAVFFSSSPTRIRLIVKTVAVAVAQYTLWFYIHFAMLPNTGTGDLFMPIEFQQTLINSTVYKVPAPSTRPLLLLVLLCVPACGVCLCLFVCIVVYDWKRHGCF